MSVTTNAQTTGFDRWFELSARGSTYGREIRGGLVTFFTMAYIVVLNPLIIGTAKDVNGAFIGGTNVVTFSGFVLAHPAVSSAIIGPRTSAQLDDLLGAADVSLSTEVLDRIDALVAPGTDVDPANFVDVSPDLGPQARRRAR